MTIETNLLNTTLEKVKSCNHCLEHLPHGTRPVVQVGSSAKILIAGQAPGSKVHSTGVPFDDPSGDRLRLWMGIDKSVFYDESKVAILPMGFCYPGMGKSGDLPPRKECADLWRDELLSFMPDIRLTLVIGMYALKWHIPEAKKDTLTHTVKSWRTHWPSKLPLPHPSPRNNIWLKKNAWFEGDVIPSLQDRVKALVL
jgi:uracil-DNA glycosylase